MNVRDLIRDVITHTDIKGINVVKFVSKGGDNFVEAIDEEKTVLCRSKLKEPVDGLNDIVIGFGNIPLLRALFGEKGWHTDEPISLIDRDGKPVGVCVEKGTSTARYIFMPESVIPPIAKFKGVEWDLTVNLSNDDLTEFNIATKTFEHAADSFTMFVDDNKLKARIGGVNTHNAVVTLVDDIVVRHEDNQNIVWSLPLFKQLLKICRERTFTMHIYFKGVIALGVESEYGVWEYIVPGRVMS